MSADSQNSSPPRAADNRSAGTPRTVRGGPIPVAWPLFWRFATWRGGFPFGATLIALGCAFPKYGGMAVLGITVVLTALMIRLARKSRADWRRARQQARAAAEPPPAEPVHVEAYYAAWVGHDPVPGPYSAAQHDDLPHT